MKPSRYNFIWPADDPDKVIIFNSYTTALVEAGRLFASVLDLPYIDYESLAPAVKAFVDGLRTGGFVLDDEIDESKLLKLSWDSARYNPSTLVLTIAPTLQCNYECVYCYERSPEGEDRSGASGRMSAEVQDQLIEFIAGRAKALRHLEVTWYGREPLLAKDVISALSERIMKLAEEHDFSYEAGIVTNGYVIAKDPSTAVLLRDTKVSWLQVTVDGPPDVHNQRRPLKGGGETFAQTLTAVQLALGHGIKVSIRINVDQTNRTYLRELLEILASHKLQGVTVSLGRLRPQGAACRDFQGACMTLDEQVRLEDELNALIAQYGFRARPQEAYPTLTLGCMANRRLGYVVDCDGDLYKCWNVIGIKEKSIGNLTGLTERTKRQRMEEAAWLTWEPFEYEKCRQCKALPICMGGCSYQVVHEGAAEPECFDFESMLERRIRQKVRALKQN
ncbi:MAG: SPASM domain-containing protein [Firmicutes bacterium]|jgi:uncharacterized protein|nr:SPASM domain-containing protein [Bacillota bacterium]